MIPCILIADDDKGIIEVYRQIMKRYGFEVRHTTKLKDMEKKIDANEIDCIHMDILFDPKANEPYWDKSNGLSELSNVLKGRADIPVMIISGYIDARAKQHANEYGVNNAIYKWYSKPADYDIIALDTIKSINDIKSRKLKNEMENYAGSLDKGNIGLFKMNLSEISNVNQFIKLHPLYLLEKLEDLIFEMISNLPKKNYILENFKMLVRDHLLDYFRNVSNNHSALAEHFLKAISRAKDENILTKKALECMLNVLNKFRDPALSNEDVYEVKVSFKDVFKIDLFIKTKNKVRKEIESELYENLSSRKIKKLVEKFCSEYGIEFVINVAKDIDKKVFSKQIYNFFSYLNFVSYQNMRDELVNKYPNHYVAFLDGRKVAQNSDKNDLIKEVYKHFTRTDIFITKISEEQQIIKIKDLENSAVKPFDTINTMMMKSERKLEFLSINKIVNEVVHDIKNEIRKKDVRIEVTLDENLSKNHAYFDEILIGQAIRNLIANSLKWITRNGWIRVSTKQLVSYISVTVEDNGKGVKPEIGDFIFEPFFTTSSEGYGIGLFFVKTVARIHEGDAKLISPKNPTIFEFTISKELKNE